MKPYHLIAPALALAGSAYWLYHQNNLIEEVTEKTRIIRERIVVVENSAIEVSPVLGSPVDEAGHDEFTNPDGSLDWKAISDMMVESQGNSGGIPTNIKAMLKLEQRFQVMTEDEIIDGLQALQTLDLDKKAGGMLKHELIDKLADKNPHAALAAFGDPITDQSSNLYWVQTNIIQKLAKKDPAAAIAWLDKHAAAGKFESTSLDRNSDARLQMEGSVIRELISEDFATAKSRLETLSKSEKIHILSNRFYNNLRGEMAINYIKIARESLPPAEATNAITKAFGNTYHDSVSKISEAVSELPLNPTEKDEVLTHLTRNYLRNKDTVEDFQEIYRWSQTEAPGKESEFISDALAKLGNPWGDPQSGFTKAVSISEALGDPEILTDFVSKYSNGGQEAFVLDQIKKFKDPDLAQKYQALVDALPPQNSDSE